MLIGCTGFVMKYSEVRVWNWFFLCLFLPAFFLQADPEIQQILRDPQMSIVLQNAQENPAMLKE